MKLLKNLQTVLHSSKGLWQKSSVLTKSILIISCILAVVFATVFSLGQWYKISHQSLPMKWGTSWSFKYAREIGVDPYLGLTASLSDLGIDRVRLMSYWDMHEPQMDSYDWRELDWQIAEANKYGIEVVLAIGLRQPRWPECHQPEWAKDLEKSLWKEQLYDYIVAVVNRYDDQVSEYQLENEFHLDAFGICPDHDRQRLIEEFDLVKSITNKPVAMSRSTNIPNFPLGQPQPDAYGLSLYKRFWNGPTKSYLEFPTVPWYYSFLAAGNNILHPNKPVFIHELQAEPFGPRGTADISQTEASRSMDVERLRRRLEFAHNTGIRTIDIWGSEWHYAKMVNDQDPAYWQTVQAAFNRLK